MKAIVSHDIDHLTLSEHYLKDLIVPKYFVRNNIELLTNNISLKEYTLRLSDIYRNKWQYIEELATFDISQSVNPTFFIAVNKGVGLSYSINDASSWIHKIKQLQCEIGIHGIEFETLEKIQSEHELFKSISNLDSIGGRLHYIRTNDQTFANLSNAGYLFDSSEMAFKAPYKIGHMWEFPFQIMDGYIIEKPKQRQSKTLQQSCDETKKIIDKVIDMQLPYLGIDFHDRYFSNRHQTWKDWYMWLIDYLKSHKIEFVNFKQAIQELEKAKS